MAVCSMQMLPGTDFRSAFLSSLQPTSFCSYDKAACLMVTLYKLERNTFEYQQVTGHWEPVVLHLPNLFWALATET